MFFTLERRQNHERMELLNAMADVHTREQRSYNMSRVRGSGNKSTELQMARILRSARIRGWRRKLNLSGKPDFVFPKRHVAIFIDGCFWHVCPRGCKPPPNNNVFWAKKLSENRLRDRNVNQRLRQMGWTVVRIWEHEIKNRSNCLIRIGRAILNRRPETPALGANEEGDRRQGQRSTTRLSLLICRSQSRRPR